MRWHLYIHPPEIPTGIPQAREHTAAAIATLVLALNDPRRAVDAAKALLAFGWGRPGGAPAQRRQPDGRLV